MKGCSNFVKNFWFTLNDAPIMCGEEEREDMEMEVDVDSFWIGSDSDEDFNEESGDVERLNGCLRRNSEVH